MNRKACIALFLTSALPLSAQIEYSDGVFEFSVGPSAHFPISDYVGRMAGLNLAVDYISAYGNVYMFDMNIGVGNAKEEFPTGEGWIENNDDLIAPHIYFNYGRIMKETEKFRTFPFGGIGVGGYELNHDTYDEYYPSKAGISFDAGFCLDWVFTRRYRSDEEHSHALRIKPFIAMTRLSAPLKWVPSLNLSVSYTFGTTF